MPVTLAGAEISLMSSMNPTAKITSGGEQHAERLGVVVEHDVERRRCSHAVASAATNPTNIARPPTSGSGVWWTVRSFGRYTQPRRRANQIDHGRGHERDHGCHGTDQQIGTELGHGRSVYGDPRRRRTVRRAGVRTHGATVSRRRGRRGTGNLAQRRRPPCGRPRVRRRRRAGAARGRSARR